YTGFSMGGHYVKRWKDEANPQLTRYTPRPSEVSLVDNPCIPTATFAVVKEDGSIELRKFRPALEIEKHDIETNDIETNDIEEHDIAKAGARHSKDDIERVQALHDTAVDLGASCSGAGDDDEEEEGDAGETEKLAKRSDVARLLGLIEAQDARIAALEAQPVAGGPVLRGARTIAKSGEIVGPENAVEAFRRHLDTLAPDERVLALMK